MMSQEKKAETFNTLATAIDSFAWVSANTLKEKFGTIDDEEEYKKIEQEVVDYAQSDEFKEIVAKKEFEILQEIANTAIECMRECVEDTEDGND